MNAQNTDSNLSFKIILGIFLGLITHNVHAQNNCSNPNLAMVLNGYLTYDRCVDFNNDGTVNAQDLAIFLGGTPQTPTLTGGTGFSAETPQPPAQGDASAPGYDAKAIARWNFVPSQILSEAFNIGVVAFHREGINRVEFSLDGGPVVAVSQARLNSDSNTEEYFVRVDPAQLAVGLREVRAVIYPNSGIPRVLSGALNNPNTSKGEYSMFFVADAQRSLPRIEKYVSPLGSDNKGDGSLGNPFQSIMKAIKSINTQNGGKADGGIVNLLPGEHHYGTYSWPLFSQTLNSFLTIRPAPGVNSIDAPIVSASSGGLALSRVRLQNVTVKPSGSSNSILVSPTGLGGVRILWLDGCTMLGVGRTSASSWTGGWTHGFVTDTFITDSADGINGELVRNVAIDTIGSDAFSGAKLVINSTVRKIDASGTQFHPDFFQLFSTDGSTNENHILVNAEMIEPSVTQGLFAGANDSIKDIAFKNVIVRAAPSSIGYIFQYGGPTKHMLIDNSQIIGAAIWRLDSYFDGEDVVIRNTNFSSGVPSCNIPDRCDITVIND